MSINPLNDKVIIVTGGSGGIGSAIVNKLVSYDANVISVYNDNYPYEQSGENVAIFKADLKKSEEWDKLIFFVLNNHGKIEVLINCAGTLEPGRFISLDEKQIKKMVEVNLDSVMIGVNKTLKIMIRQESGHIINIGSLGGIVPMPYCSVYSATKFALRGFSFSLAEELKGKGINVSLITPNSVATKMLDHEANGINTAISFVSKPISPSLIANEVLKVIIHPKRESVIPKSQSFTSKVLSLSPFMFSKLYPLLHRIGKSRKITYMNRYCSFNLMEGVTK
jgi:short-subunit dehydrogenase